MRLCYQISLVSSFVTNSSSVVHGYDRKALDHPEVKAFMKAYGIEEGYVGDDLFCRSTCESIVITDSQKYEVSITTDDDGCYAGLPVSNDPNTFFLIYGDEYNGAAQELNCLLGDIEQRENVTFRTFSSDYN